MTARLCIMDGCDRVHYGKGLCKKHYGQSYRKSIERLCSITGCDGKVDAREMCHAHFERVRKHGDPNHGGPLLRIGDTLGRFFAKVDKNGPPPQPGTLAYERGITSPCWVWTNSQHGKGYGSVSYKGRLRSAHIVSFLIHGGALIEGMELDHLCRVRLCVNPEHLEQVTHAENIRRGDTGIFYRSKTHCPKNHPYDEDNTCYGRRSKDGGISRSCRTCKREKQRIQRARRLQSGQERELVAA